MLDFSIITAPLFYAVAIPAVLSMGIAKAGIGGTGGLATPLMALAVTVPQAAAILLPIICIADIFAITVYRKKWDRDNIKIMIPAAAVGIIFGTLSFKYLDPAAIKIVIGAIAVVFALERLLNYLLKKEVREPTKPAVIKGGFWCSISGFTSFVAHSGAPPLNVYIIPQKMDKSIYMGTLAIYYAFVNYAKIVPYWWLGQFHITNLWTSVVLLPVVPVGILLGLWIHKNVNDVLFYRIIITLLFFTGLKLLYDGITTLI